MYNIFNDRIDYLVNLTDTLAADPQQALTEVGRRLASFLAQEGISINQAGRDTGLGGPNVSNMTNGKNFTAKNLLLLWQAYGKLNLDWLLTGRGQMMYATAAPATTATSATPTAEADHQQAEADLKNTQRALLRILQKNEALEIEVERLKNNDQNNK